MFLLDFNDWWAAQGTIAQIYWLFAIAGSIGMVFILVTTFMGGDMDGDMDVDTEVQTDHGVGFQFFTLKNMIAFFTLFGWSGIACIDAELPLWATILISVACGVAMSLAMAALLFFMSKLTDSGTLSLNNAIGGFGEVYLPIPAGRNGFGQVQINVQGGLRTLQAMTDDPADIAVGRVVEVMGVVNEQILLVRNSAQEQK